MSQFAHNQIEPLIPRGSSQAEPNCPPRRCLLRLRPTQKLTDQAQLSLPFFDAPGESSAPDTNPLPAASTSPHSAQDAHSPSSVAEPPVAPHAAHDRQAPVIRPRRAGDRIIQFGQYLLPYVLKRSNRKSIGFLIDDDGLRVTAPRWVGLGDIETSLREKESWILRKLAEWQERKTHRIVPEIAWQAGATLPYLGQIIRIELGAQTTQLDVVQSCLRCALPLQASSQQIKDTLHAWLQHEARQIFGVRMQHFVSAFAMPLQEWRLSAATTQWGSCTANGTIRLNWRLIHFPLNVIDYVIAHELAHLRQMNHSPKFWAEVETLMPNYRDARQFLRKHHPEHLPLFTD